MSTPPNPENEPQVTQGEVNPPVPTQPPSPAPEQPKQEPQHSGNAEIGSLMTALAALPEKIVDSLRESMQPANPPAASNSTQNAQPGNPAPVEGAREPGKKSFTDWWFGK